MAAKLEAHYENRIYFFTVTAKTATEISIDMYTTPYTFIKTEKGWENRMGNKMNMVPGLIEAVIKAVNP